MSRRSSTSQDLCFFESVVVRCPIAVHDVLGGMTEPRIAESCRRSRCRSCYLIHRHSIDRNQSFSGFQWRHPTWDLGHCGTTNKKRQQADKTFEHFVNLRNTKEAPNVRGFKNPSFQQCSIVVINNDFATCKLDLHSVLSEIVCQPATKKRFSWLN
jgi:hypothetical protein